MPPNSLLVAGLFSGASLYYTGHLTVRYEALDSDLFQLMRSYAGNAGLRWYALLSDVEMMPEELPKRLPGNWTAIGRYRDITLWRLDD